MRVEGLVDGENIWDRAGHDCTDAYSGFFGQTVRENEGGRAKATSLRPGVSRRDHWGVLARPAPWLEDHGQG